MLLAEMGKVVDFPFIYPRHWMQAAAGLMTSFRKFRYE